MQMEELSEEQLHAKVYHEFPRRMLSVLAKKLARGYHELPHCAGKPFVLMLAPFFEPGSVYYSDECLRGSLYGDPDYPPPSTPFFYRDGAEAISAILYCNAFTVPRFFRLATKLDATSKLIAFRMGMCCLDHSDTTLAFGEYRYVVGDLSAPKESWFEGVTLFHNPNAVTPLPQGLLPATSTFSVRDGGLCREIHGFHPLTSFMRVHPRSNSD